MGTGGCNLGEPERVDLLIETSFHREMIETISVGLIELALVT